MSVKYLEITFSFKKARNPKKIVTLIHNALKHLEYYRETTHRSFNNEKKTDIITIWVAVDTKVKEYSDDEDEINEILELINKLHLKCEIDVYYRRTFTTGMRYIQGSIEGEFDFEYSDCSRNFFECNAESYYQFEIDKEYMNALKGIQDNDYRDTGKSLEWRCVEVDGVKKWTC